MPNLNTTNDGVSKSGILYYIGCTNNRGDTFPDTIQPSFIPIVIPLQAPIVGRSPDILDSVTVHDVGIQI